MASPPRIRVEHGDCLEVMRRLAAEGVKVDAIVTDPPYHLTSIVNRFGKPGAAPAKHGRDGAFARATAGFMGQTWDGGDVAFRVETWRLARALLKPGGHLAAFSGTRTYHRLAAAIEAAGFDMRDRVLDVVCADAAVRRFMDTLDEAQAEAFLHCIAESAFGGELAWIYGTGMPKSHDLAKAIDKAAGAVREVVGTERVRDIRNGHGRAVGEGIHAAGRDGPVYMDRQITAPATDAAKAWDGWGTALKPAFEPIALARAPLDGTVAETVLRHGTGALNIEACRIPAEKPVWWGGKAAGGGTWNEETCGLGKDGAARPVDGRWPANVTHDGSAEVLAAFAACGERETSGGVIRRNAFAGLGGNEGGAFAERAGRVSVAASDSGSAARFFFSGKAGADDRFDSKHPTVKRVDLLRWIVRMITPPGGLVLDLFAGTGTTGVAAAREGCRAILIEREAKYVADIERRIAALEGRDGPLFAPAGEGGA